MQPARASLISVSVSILPEAGSDRQTCQAFLRPSGAEPRCSLIGQRIPPTNDIVDIDILSMTAIFLPF